MFSALALMLGISAFSGVSAVASVSAKAGNVSTISSTPNA